MTDSKTLSSSDSDPEVAFLDTAESLWDPYDAPPVAFEESPRPRRGSRPPKQSTKASRPRTAKPISAESTVEPPAEAATEPAPTKKRRRRRSSAKQTEEVAVQPAESVVAEPVEASPEPAPAKKKRRRRSRTKKTEELGEQSAEEVAVPPAEPVVAEPVEASSEPVPAKKKRRRRSRTKKTEELGEQLAEEVTEPTVEPVAAEPAEATPEPAPAEKKRRSRSRKKKTERPVERPADAVVEEDQAEQEPESPEEAPVETTRKKRSESSDSASGFAALGLSDVMLDALTAADYLEPTPVQAGLIPRAMQGVDVMGQAQTGTGKTAAFAIPILEQIVLGKHRGPQALVLVPTRELAVQVRDEMAKLARGSRVRIVAAYGGKPVRQQAEKISRGAEIVVGTPGRLLDHMARGTLFAGDLRQLVLDEADRMLDIGFRPDIEKILRQCPQSRQTLLLSATLPAPVLRLAQRYMRDPESLDFSPTDIAVETIEQFYFTVDPDQKFDLLVRLIEREQPKQAIVFCRTRRGTDKVHQRLQKKVGSVAAIHGDLQQRVRDRVMESFRGGRLCILVATDVVGRGIDVTGISHIINFDIPEFCDDYVHRVGRTGRMGREGVAYTFVSPEQGNELTRIEMRINRLLKRGEMSGFDEGTKPEGSGEPLPEEEKPEAKPVFGRRGGRRVRRAL